ncbi:MAG TPA: hydrogenase maturation protease [Labilithrix sp.]|nr:hydrogenase maturation protease [Labilithrix sp.]
MILVAGIGNVFNRDDAFGVEVVRRLATRGLDGAQIVDFGIRGFDLALALTAGIDAAVLVDASPRGGPAGTLYVLEPDDLREAEVPDGHGIHPLRALALARAIGGLPKFVRIVACEPEDVDEGEGLSAPVTAALKPAIDLVAAIVREASHA